MRVLCVWRVTGLTECTCSESSGVVELVRPARPDLSDVRYGGDQGRADVRWENPSHGRTHQKVFVCERALVYPAYKI